ncbi:MAG: signal recognition particle-docking protein FtsY [Oceanospirillaceae bacterium]|jgi:fused signal recognition particle receptor|nr:signal recognition particle-docking protein FtsY [Oceanospirillaceae bacterium]MBT6099986.1 signal recognition particle-docking protein FtsY [Oceanospirillaceae bacterium]MDC1424798.1 signal recognition particle-docking protein FtsY [Oceanospirillaceae bacterium]
MRKHRDVSDIMALFNLFGKNKNTAEAQKTSLVEAPKQPLQALTDSATTGSDASQPMETNTANSEPKQGFFGRIKSGLSRTRSNLGDGLASLFLGAKQIDEDLFEELETQLLVADVGIEATASLLKNLSDRVARKDLTDPAALYSALKEELAALLQGSQAALEIPQQDNPFVILMVGVNGAGKTTTIGKLSKRFQSQGKSVLLAAGDTFRAAAVEQLQEWGSRNNVPVVAQHTGADSASVIFDAVQSAQAKGIDVVIADTAGRLQNKSHLMDELSKVVRVMQKLDANAPHEVMLVLDAATGQNAISQASLFGAAVGVTGITLTKLDGTAKGGVIFAMAQQLQLPIRFIGVGEQADDLRPFEATEFIDALFSETSLTQDSAL